MKGEIELYNISFLILKVELHFKRYQIIRNWEQMYFNHLERPEEIHQFIISILVFQLL